MKEYVSEMTREDERRRNAHVRVSEIGEELADITETLGYDITIQTLTMDNLKTIRIEYDKTKR